MKAICPREVLLSACQLASAALPPREVKDIKPILKNIKAVAQEGRCTLMTTDLEIAIRLDVMRLTIQEPGEAILPASSLINILRESRDNELELTADTNSCIVQGESLYFEMPGEDPAEFPEWPSFNEEKYHEVTAGVFREMIRRTNFAVADASARHSISGVLIELDGDTIHLVATDGHRLALTSGPGTAGGGHSTKGQAPVVPTKALSLVERNLQGDADELVRISVRANDILFRTETSVIYSRLVEGRFPNYRQILPTKHNCKVVLPVQSFMAAVRQAAIMTDDESKKLTFRFDRKKLVLEAHGQTKGRSKVELPVELDGKPIQINFNPAYVLDLLKVLPPDGELMLEMEDPSRPAMFRFGINYSYLAMPLS